MTGRLRQSDYALAARMGLIANAVLWNKLGVDSDTTTVATIADILSRASDASASSTTAPTIEVGPRTGARP